MKAAIARIERTHTGAQAVQYKMEGPKRESAESQLLFRNVLIHISLLLTTLIYEELALEND